MNDKKSSLIEHQLRAFNEGTVECINNEWIFFDDERDEAHLLEDFYYKEIHIKSTKFWKKGILLEPNRVQGDSWEYELKEHDIVRIRKNLSIVFELLIQELSDHSFFQFVTGLNRLGFSLYDLIYCHNQLTFLENTDSKVGVNFMIFDNTEQICAVQHHFNYQETKQDRFEFTLNTSERVVLHEIHPPSSA